MDSSLQKFLNEVTINRKAFAQAKRRFASRYAPDFRLFDYMRGDEMSLSYCFATLLDPNGKHGQGNRYMRLFCDHFLKEVEWIRPDDLPDIRVITEHQTHTQRRLDLFIEIRDIGIIGIENKPWAADQDQQLIDYATYLERHGRNWILLYFCNSDPSEESITEEKRKTYEDTKNFAQISFDQITDWLQECLNETRPTIVRTFIEELTKYISESINGEYDMDEQNAVKKTILDNNTNNLTSAFAITLALSDIKEDLLKKLRDDLQYFINDRKGERLLGNSRAFNLRSDKLDPYNLSFCIEFTKTMNDSWWGLVSTTGGTFLTSADHDNARQLLSNSSGSSNKYWGWYSYDFSLLNLPGNVRNWNKSPAPWLAINNGSLVNRISEIWKEIIKNATAMSNKSETKDSTAIQDECAATYHDEKG